MTRALIVADIGSNHRRSLEAAYRLIYLAKEAGADAAKFQLFRADRLYPKASPHHGPARRNELPAHWLSKLKGRCDELGIEFMCSAFDKLSVAFVDQFVLRHKIAGIEAHDASFVRYVLSRGKPVILTRSLGLRWWRVLQYRLQSPGLTVLHGVTAYPAAISDVHLRSHPRGRWGVSDHTVDPLTVPCAAVAMGASVVEKHLRLPRQRKSPDAGHSLDPIDFAAMVSAIRRTEQALGSDRFAVRESEFAYLALRRGKDGLRGT